MLLLLFALGSGFISGDIMSTKAWIVVAAHASILTILLLVVMLPSSYINKQTQFQMKRLIFLKEVYQWIVRDQSIVQQNPKRLDTKIQRLAVTILREATSDLNGDEKIEKMNELATSVYEALSDAIDEIEKDEELNPKKFLGVALYPDKLWGWFTTLATIGIGLAQQHLTASE